MTVENCIIIGASHAGVSLALQLRREGWTGGIQLLSADPELPYHRPPLSKDFLAGAKTGDQIRLRPEKVYADNAIELMMNCEVTAIDCAARTIALRDGGRLAYSRLALCVGAQVRTLPLAGPGNNVFYIRTLADVTRLTGNVQAGKRAVLVGGGYIGLEAAAQLVQKGVEVTLLEVADRILNRVTAPELSNYFSALHASHGVVIRTGVSIEAISATDKASSIRIDDGSEIEADFIIVGIGISPNTGLAASAGLLIDQGIVVDEYARTSDPNIYAAGDCTLHPSALYRRQLRLESVQNATDQARIAAANICGKNIVYDTVPWFWSDQYDIKLQTAGLNTGYDAIVVRGDPTNASGTGFVVFYLQQGRLVAADCINRPKEFMASKQFIRSGVKVNLQSLADDEIDIVNIAS